MLFHLHNTGKGLADNQSFIFINMFTHEIIFKSAINTFLRTFVQPVGVDLFSGLKYI